ncbi:Ferric enterobactin esterase [Blastochloris viridis]|uniref:Ferric enterobactin esterase n=1 Tax=Blastochloris viridis TaxID=1079 RepID=A0A0S4Q4P6_BLAVI|nr:Ferric enterobactin esterase [Blastochloris viridis]
MLVTAPAHAAPPASLRLDAGVAEPVDGLAAGARAAFDLAAATGDYVRGEIAVTAGRFDLDLVGPGGHHVRRLASDLDAPGGFQFIVAEAPVRLVVTARTGGGGATLSVAAKVAPAAQKAPTAQFVSPAIAALATHVAAGGSTDAFWQERARQGTPLVEPGPPGMAVVTFVARGARRNVRLLGAPSGDHEWMDRLGESDTWFRSFLVPEDTRLSYKLAPDVPDLPGTPREQRMAILATAQADPLNPAPWPTLAPDPFNQESTLELPRAPAQPGLDDRGAPKGTLAEFRLRSARLGNARTITLYTPAGFDPADQRNVLLLVFDARAYLTKVPTPTILDNLIANRRLPPMIAAFISEVDPRTRAHELPGNPAFADFMAEQVLPLVGEKTGTRIPASRTILAGSSFGGLAAATIALRHPDRFGNAIALSGSFWWHPDDAPADAPEHVADLVARSPRKAVRFHLTAGMFEAGHTGTAGILDTSRHLRDVLRAKDYDVSYREYAGGHDYLVWRGALADALLALVPRL